MVEDAISMIYEDLYTNFINCKKDKSTLKKIKLIYDKDSDTVTVGDIDEEGRVFVRRSHEKIIPETRVINNVIVTRYYHPRYDILT